MKRELGIAYCGLACCFCGEHIACPGCGAGGCKDKENCKNYTCCREKGLDGCWECEVFPCKDSMLRDKRIRAFARFVKIYGKETLLDCLERNEKAGLVYHKAGSLEGDYDLPESEEGIIELILTGEVEV